MTFGELKNWAKENGRILESEFCDGVTFTKVDDIPDDSEIEREGGSIDVKVAAPGTRKGYKWLHGSMSKM